MRIGAATNYAARALVELAAAPGQLLPLPAIAERQGISLRFLEHIFRDLRTAGLVTSQRGGHGHGGYRLSVPAEELTLAAVVAATHTEGQPSPSPPPAQPRPAGVEVLDAVWSALEVETRNFLSAVTIADLAAEGRRPVVDEMLRGVDVDLIGSDRRRRETSDSGCGAPAGCFHAPGPAGHTAAG